VQAGDSDSEKCFACARAALVRDPDTAKTDAFIQKKKTE